jgi:SLA1 homology domain 1, SHD1
MERSDKWQLGVRTLGMALLWLSGSSALAREWTDATGKVKQEGDLVDFDGHLAVLKKGDGHLVAIPVEKLSQADQEFLASKLAKDEMKSQGSKDRTWTMTNGIKVSGRVLKYGRKELVLTRKESKLWALDKPWSDLNEWQKYVILQIASKGEKREFKTEKQLESLLVARKGEPLVYPVEGVMIELEDGELFAAPFFLFSEKDLAVLEPGWKAWVAAEKDEQRREEQSMMLRSVANEYQKNKEIEHKIQLLHAASDWFDLWEVTLSDSKGNMVRVVVPARDSRSAQMAALLQHPKGTIQQTRKVRKRF